MIRVLLLFSVFCAPLLAVAPSTESPLALDSLDVIAVLSMKGESIEAEITCTASLRNTGGSASVELQLPVGLVPKSEREEFAITVGTALIQAQKQRNEHFLWTVHFDAEQVRSVTWTITRGVAQLPQAHPLGRTQLTVPLDHIQKLVQLPESLGIEIRHAGFAPELFGQSGEDRALVRQPIAERIEDFSYQWFTTTLGQKTNALKERLSEFTDSQRIPENRSYTQTLVSLTELYELAENQVGLAETCSVLADLEVTAGHVITHCGPWAAWRTYVPWRLRQLQALKAAQGETADCVKACLTLMEKCWAAYTEATNFARPFDHFDVAKFGAFWDYDWVSTRDLYATALELDDKPEMAAEVRKTDTPQ
ncbi:MAG: hypothetical protein R3E76_02895 [Planctomycetota bacterium]